MHFLIATTILLAPGFSPVLVRIGRVSRFNGFFAIAEAAEAANADVGHEVTGLKPGANQRIKEKWFSDFENTP
jgi:hypothetical protein